MPLEGGELSFLEPLISQLSWREMCVFTGPKLQRFHKHNLHDAPRKRRKELSQALYISTFVKGEGFFYRP